LLGGGGKPLHTGKTSPPLPGINNSLCRSGYEEENIYAKVDDMTYYPVVGPIQTMAGPGDQVRVLPFPKFYSVPAGFFKALPFHIEIFQNFFSALFSYSNYKIV
jgi:hypothetical protein